MNCRTFERDVADWAGGHLPAGEARDMAAHARRCAPCARSARAEQRLRERWRETRDTTPLSDVWPRLAARLGERPRRGPSGPGRLVWVSAVAALVTIGVLGLSPRTTHTPPPDRAVAVSPPQAGPDRWPMLPGVSRVEPSVDDPVGQSMEEVWTQLDTRAAPPGG